MPSNELELILSWLPANTQSVLVANGPFQLHELPDNATAMKQMMEMAQHKDAWWKYAPKPRQMLRWNCALSQNFHEVAERKLYQYIKKHTITHSVKAALEYVPDLGTKSQTPEWRARSFNITLYQSSDADWRSFLSLLQSVSSSRYTDSGYTVFACETDSQKTSRQALVSFDRFCEQHEKHLIAEGKAKEALESKYKRSNRREVPLILVCAPRAGLLLTSFGHKEALHQILQRISDSDSKRSALLPDLPEWKLVNLKADVFGLRDFSRSQTGDLTSPREENSFTTDNRKTKSLIDPKAVGLVVNLAGNNVEYTYLSDSKDLPQILGQLFPRSETGVDVTKDGRISVLPGQIQVQLDADTLTGSQSWSKAVFWLGSW